MIAQFSLRLLCGMSLMWCCMPRQQVTSGFFRIQMLVALGLSVLAAITWGQFSSVSVGGAPAIDQRLGTLLSGVLGGVAFLGSVLWTLERRPAGTRACFLIATGSAAVLLGGILAPRALGTSAGLAMTVSELSTALLLGGMLSAMLLGHWYLTAPTMSIAPLSRLTQIIGIAVFVRFLSSTWGVADAWSQIDSNTHLLWLSLRWTAGIIGPAAVVIMVLRILRYRNTQSATGVLFVGVILTFIGELTATLLFQELQVPL